MKMRISVFLKLFLLILFGSFFNATESLHAQESSRESRRAGKLLEKLDKADLFYAWEYMGRMAPDSVFVNNSAKDITVFLSSDVSRIPVRKAWIKSLEHRVKNLAGRRYKDYDVYFICKGHALDYYIPLFYSDNQDSLRMAVSEVRVPLVKRVERDLFHEGLEGRYIALWPSHGYYYEAELDRWEWQRARLFQTVEDIYPFAFTRNFLVPMLEDAGATVFLPRERDIQHHEVIVDNDVSTGKSEIRKISGATDWENVEGEGFAIVDTLFGGDNPFEKGSHLKMQTASRADGRLIYIADIPENGEYAVYISWGRDEMALDNVPCIVNHSGGQTRFQLNQQMANGTWVYLGTFHFTKGKNESGGSVVLEAPSVSSRVVTADAVRFGGGMGHVARRPGNRYVPREWSLNDERTEAVTKEKQIDYRGYSWKISGVPRWMEAARYYLQYAGMPDSLVYDLNDGKNDYNDDYQSRGEWVNYLMGSPNGPTENPDAPGLNIPIDLAFAFHTDAGKTPGDSVIGTLGIYSSERNDGVFPSGQSKMASRDLTDVVQSQIVTDVRLQFKDDWTRRAMWDRQYSEAWRPNVPTMLLELLSHQNPADMKYGLDPRFQFTVARAVYKGMARFLAAREGRQAIIKPLAPDHMSIQQVEGRRVRISWSPVHDPLEPTAVPSGYRVFQRVEDNGFESGIFSSDTSIVLDLPEYDTIYSFKVSALNAGGISFPGETLSVSIQENADDMVLIVNAFDRVSPPAFEEGNVSGVAWWQEEGVPWHHQISYTGRQYDYDRSSPWLDDDSPGHGASYANMEGQIIAGNTFDFVFTHGQAIRDAGYSFVSVSDEVFEKGSFESSEYFAVDLIYGEERGTESLLTSTGKDFRVWTPNMREVVSNYLESGGNIFVSGAYIGTDMIENEDSLSIGFAEEILHYKWRTNYADNVGSVEVTDEASSLFLPLLKYNVDFERDIYKVEAPDGLEPSGDGASRIFRYASNGVSAGVAYSGHYRSVVLGFPFETVVKQQQRHLLMKQILSFFARNMGNDI